MIYLSLNYPYLSTKGGLISNIVDYFCIREFVPFDGKHQDTVVVSELKFSPAVESPLDLITPGVLG